MIKLNYIKTYTKEIYVNGKEKLNIKFNDYINQLLLGQLTTLKGRVDAIKSKYKLLKLTPIYINKYMCLFPIYNLKDYENIFINVFEIKTLDTINKKTRIEFINGDKLIVNKNINVINNYIRRAISINHNS